jgi:magnesium chelatase family protein
MVGSPGSGKTLLARALPSILPEMSIEESLDATRIYSVADQLPAGTPLIRHRPFRAPHHTISYAGLVGGGNIPKPGEISLAHRGVLFLDEFPEFGTRVLEVMRQPMEDKVVTISRANHNQRWDIYFDTGEFIEVQLCVQHASDLRQSICLAAQFARPDFADRCGGVKEDTVEIRKSEVRHGWFPF